MTHTTTVDNTDTREPVCGRNHKMSLITTYVFFLHAAITCNITANHQQHYLILITWLTSGDRNLAPKDEAYFYTCYYWSISVGAIKEPKFGASPTHQWTVMDQSRIQGGSMCLYSNPDSIADSPVPCFLRIFTQLSANKICYVAEVMCCRLK